MLFHTNGSDDKKTELAVKQATEDYKIWKKHTPLFYDLIQTKILSWPSLIAEWLPDKKLSDTDDCAKQSVLTGTQSLNQDNFISAVSFRLPKKETLFELRYDDLSSGLGGFGVTPSGFEESEYRLSHPGPVSQAKSMPQDYKIIATQTTSGGILIYNNKNNQSLNQSYSHLTDPKRLTRGFSWNPNKEGTVMCHSDSEIFEYSCDANQLTNTFSSIKSIISVDCHSRHPTIYAVCGGGIQIGDTRPSTQQTIEINHKHTLPVTGFSWNPLNEFMFAECSEDKTIGIWDLRHPQSPLHSLEHDLPVGNVHWSPFMECVLGSSDDKKVLLWNLADVGKIQTDKAKLDGPPELLFIHRGHTDKINDFSWNPTENWIIASVASDNILQVWKLAEYIYNGAV